MVSKIFVIFTPNKFGVSSSHLTTAHLFFQLGLVQRSHGAHGVKQPLAPMMAQWLFVGFFSREIGDVTHGSVSLNSMVFEFVFVFSLYGTKINPRGIKSIHLL